MMTTWTQPASSLCPTFEQLRDRGRDALDAGRLDEALELLDRASEIAHQRDDEHLIDLAYANRSSVLINLGRQNEVMTRLRAILMRNRNAENCFLAAYNLSRAHVRNKAYKKGLFYARIARDRAESLDRTDWMCSSHNQIGNCLMDESYFEEAAGEYRLALDLEADPKSLLHASLITNLGYCHMMLGDLEKGFQCAFQSLRRLRRLGAELYLVWPHLDLCYAYLESGRYRRAYQHGYQALTLAERIGDPDRIKTALFLLGETEREAGDTQGAVETFSHLQTRFYPEAPEIVSLMAAIEMRQVVNLRT